MKPFHCVVQVAPPMLPHPQTITIDGQPVETIPVAHIATRFVKTFEAAAQSLECLPRMYFEPDGSFVWVVEDQERFQLDGSLYDDGVSLLNVDLKGTCNHEMLNQFLDCVRNREDLLFQLVQHGTYLNECTFRNHFIA